MYQALQPDRSEFVPIRHLRYHVRIWGQPTAACAPLVLLHGWMDVAASWQFVVDALTQQRWVIAPDWRGYGLSGLASHAQASAHTGLLYQPQTDNYWFADYLADLDFLLDHYSPDQPIDLVGHSMGGNVAMLYAGVRPQRVRRLVNLEGFGMPATQPEQAPLRLARWMDEIKALHRGELHLTTYSDLESVARRLIRTNPRLGLGQALWLAPHWSRPVQQSDGSSRWAILGDAAHKVVNAHLSRVEEALAHYRRISAPVLCVEAADNQMAQWWQGKYTLDEFHERLRAVPRLRREVIADAGHMLHHDQPQVLAALIEDFVDRAQA